MKKLKAIVIAAVVFAWFLAFALMACGQTQPATRPTTAPATQPTNTLPIFITGLYDPGDASKGGNLDDYIKKYWHDRYNISLAMSVYDREAEIKSLFPPTGTIVMVGHSFGADECVAIAKANPSRTFKIVMIDGVPRDGKSFSLSDNITWCIQIYRTTRSDGRTPITAYFSKPIASAKWPFKNVTFVPPVQKGPDGKPLTDAQGAQAGEHGAPVWDGTAAAALKVAMQ